MEPAGCAGEPLPGAANPAPVTRPKTLAVFSDVHGNLAAFQAVLADMRARGVSEAICLGDTVGYGPQPQECLDAVRAAHIPQLMGNHEEGLANAAMRDWFNPSARMALTRTAELLDPAEPHWMAGLPRSLTRHGAGFVHGTPPDSSTIYIYTLDDDELRQAFADCPGRICFVGHTHELELITLDQDGQLSRRPLGRELVRLEPSVRYIVNVGSVGQPRDGNNNAKYVLWDRAADMIEIRFVPYDIKATVALMAERGLPEQYAKRLW